VRVIDDQGQQLGVFPITEAIVMARNENLDLVQITDKVEPPICKITDYGKHLYREKKKEKTVKSSLGELKGIRLKFGISSHDMETRAKSALKFLEKGNKVKIELPLRGRQKALGDFAKEKMALFLEMVEKTTPIKTEKELKREGRGFTMIISKKQ
jgi:translation initiation factor IF-3